MEDEWISKKIGKYIIVNKVLGKRSFGTMYRGFCEDDQNQQLAVKIIPIKNIIETNKMVAQIKREISILYKFNNKNIVKLFEVTRTSNHLYLFLEFCTDGSLKEYLKSKKNNTLSEIEAIRFFKHILNAFKAIHSQNIIHRDIKPANIMLHEKHAKISNFSFSRIIDTDMNEEVYLTRLGTTLYMAPQILQGEAFSSKCDVWSCGIVLYEMLYGKTPWNGSCQLKLLKNIKEKGLIFPKEPMRSEQVKSLIKKMLEYKESNRISWGQVFEEQFQFGEKSLLELSMNLTSLSQNELGTSVCQNEMYLQENLVAQYLNNIEEDSEIVNSPRKLKNLSSEDKLKSYEETHEELKYDSQKAQIQIKKQMESEKIYKNTLKINEYIMYERNISFFYNSIIQKVIKQQNNKLLNAQQNLFYRLIFCLSKCQFVNLNKIVNLLNSETSAFNQELWNNYLVSPLFIKSQEQILHDISQSQDFFDQISIKTKQVVQNELKKNFGNNQQIDFLSIINNNFNHDPKFISVYQQTIDEFLNKHKNNYQQQEQVEILEILFCLQICQNPYLEFDNSNYDFNNFYEEIKKYEIDFFKNKIYQKQ